VRDEGEHKGDSEAVGLGASRCCDAEGVKLRRATVDDADFLVELLTHEEVEPYLSAISAKDREGIVAGIERSEQAPELFGQFIVEVDGRPAGAVSRSIRSSGAGSTAKRRPGRFSATCSRTWASTGSRLRSTASTSAPSRTPSGSAGSARA
jgi:hypothetical protein